MDLTINSDKNRKVSSFMVIDKKVIENEKNIYAHFNNKEVE